MLLTVTPAWDNHIVVILPSEWEVAMRRETYCEGCGETEFRFAETYAAVDDSGDIEVVAWACKGCGDRTEAAEVATFELVEEVAATRRVA
jgi:hypothetical protein